MNARNVDVVTQTFEAIEQRDRDRAFALYHPHVEFAWPPSLPYGGDMHGRATLWSELERAPERTWTGTWDPLQPTNAERRMDPRVVAANDTEVVVLYRQRGVSPSGERLNTPVLGLYEVHDELLARAQMFYFDTVAVVEFLARAARRRGPR
jgi:uncharacterized protein